MPSENPTSSEEDSTSSDEENKVSRCGVLCSGKNRSLDCASQIIVGTCSCPPDEAPLPSCVVYSPRIQGLLMGQKTKFETAREHWTVVDLTTEAEAERIGEENRKYFNEVLVKHPEWGAFFRKFKDLEVGDKIGDGGQAEIFAATSPSWGGSLVAKVWKAGVSPKDLERQWPPQRHLNLFRKSMDSLSTIFMEEHS